MRERERERERKRVDCVSERQRQQNEANICTFYVSEIMIVRRDNKKLEKNFVIYFFRSCLSLIELDFV